MAVRLHRQPPDETASPAAPARLSVLEGGRSDAPTPKLGTPRPSFPAPPTVRLAPPQPLNVGRGRDRLLTGALAALGGAAVVYAGFAGARAVVRRNATLDGVVVIRSRELAAPAAGRVHFVAERGARLEPGATVAEITVPRAAVAAPKPSPDARRLEEALRRAEAALTAARRHQSDVVALMKDERATRSEHDEAARDVRFRQAERDRLAAALAAANAPPASEEPAPIALVADAPLVLDSYGASEGEEVAAGVPLATVHPRATWVEAPLGRTRAPDEGAPVTVRLEGVAVPGHITGIHVEGATRTVTVAFDSRDPLPAGTHVAIRLE